MTTVIYAGLNTAAIAYTGGGDSGDHFSQFEFVQHRGFSSGVKTFNGISEV